MMYTVYAEVTIAAADAYNAQECVYDVLRSYLGGRDVVINGVPWADDPEDEDEEARP